MRDRAPQLSLTGANHVHLGAAGCPRKVARVPTAGLAAFEPSSGLKRSAQRATLDSHALRQGEKETMLQRSTGNARRSLFPPIALALCWFAASLAGGCGGNTETEEAKPFEGKTVSVFCEGDRVRDFIADQKAEWELASGASVQFAPSLEGSSVAVVPLSEAGELAAKVLLRALPEEVYEPDPTSPKDWPTAVRENLCQWGTVQCFAPLSVRTYVLLVRTDLVPESELDGLKEWRGLDAAIRRLSEGKHNETGASKTAAPTTNEHGRTKGLLLAPDLTTLWLLRAASYSRTPGRFAFFFDPWSGGPLITTPGFERSLQETLAVAPFVVSGTLEDFAAGDIPFAIAASDSVWPVFAKSSPVAARVEALPVPGTAEYYDHNSGDWKQVTGDVHRVTWLDGLVAAVNSDCPDPEAAVSFVQFILSPEVSLRGVTDPLAGLGPFRLSHFRRSSAWADAGWNLEALSTFFQSVQQELARRTCVETLQVRGASRLMEVLHDELLAAHSKSPSAAGEILKAMAVKWQSIIDEIGADRVAEDYRRSVGLVGLEYMLPEM